MGLAQGLGLCGRGADAQPLVEVARRRRPLRSVPVPGGECVHQLAGTLAGTACIPGTQGAAPGAMVQHRGPWRRRSRPPARRRCGRWSCARSACAQPSIGGVVGPPPDRADADPRSSASRRCLCGISITIRPLPAARYEVRPARPLEARDLARRHPPIAQPLNRARPRRYQAIPRCALRSIDGVPNHHPSITWKTPHSL